MPGNTLTLRQPLREVRLAMAKAIDPVEQKMREREQAAYERGRREGEKTLQEQLLQQRNELLELQRGVLESLRQCLPKVMRECEGGLTSLCLEAARKLVNGISISAEMAEAAVREALSQVEETTDYDIFLNPEDLDLLERANSQLLTQNTNGQKLHFHRAAEVTRGGCLVKTRFGIIDGQRETRFELLKKSVMG